MFDRISKYKLNKSPYSWESLEFKHGHNILKSLLYIIFKLDLFIRTFFEEIWFQYSRLKYRYFNWDFKMIIYEKETQ